MPGYWWECENCGQHGGEFREATGCSSIAAFIRAKLLPSDWDQSLLLRECKQCGQHSCRITYDFPRKERLVFRLVHAVGLELDDYLPVMWEFYEVGEPHTLKFDFKYLLGRNPTG